MKRNKFLKSILGLFSGMMLVKYPAAALAQTETDPVRNNSFTDKWMSGLINIMQSKLSGEELTTVLNECGRACARNGAVNMAQDCKGDVTKFLVKLSEILGPDNTGMSGNTAFIKYSKCYCPNLESFTGQMPASYCNCSKGWVMEMFETAAQKPVQVKTEQTILGGGKYCHFVITV